MMAAGIDDYLPKPVTTALRNAASVPQRLRVPGRVRGLVLSLNVARLDRTSTVRDGTDSDSKGETMGEFMDIHRDMKGISSEQLAEAHQADLDIQDDEGVNFKQAWADPESGMVFCLSEAPNADALRRIHERAGHPADEVYEVPIKA